MCANLRPSFEKRFQFILFGNEVKIESRQGRKKLSVVPMGLNKEKRIVPSVKNAGLFSIPEYYEMTSKFTW